jgi:hypothetical protein
MNHQIEINLLSFLKRIIEFYCILLQKQIPIVYVYAIQFRPIEPYHSQIVFSNQFIEKTFNSSLFYSNFKKNNIKIISYKNNLVFLSDSYEAITKILSRFYSFPNLNFPFCYDDFFKYNIYSIENEYKDYLIDNDELLRFKEFLLQKFGTQYGEWYTLGDLKW